MSDASKGRVTLPAETGALETVEKLFERWGADYIRDSDGTLLSQELIDLGHQVYSTLCIVRSDQEYPRAHPDAQPLSK